jgi:hypothetical protein
VSDLIFVPLLYFGIKLFSFDLVGFPLNTDSKHSVAKQHDVIAVI